MNFNFIVETLYICQKCTINRKMSWVIRCPTHGKVIAQYRCEGMTQLEKHSKEDRLDELCFLYEDPDI